jgi:hypothetical protein
MTDRDRQTLPTPNPSPPFARGFITNQLFMIQKQFDCITSTINVTMSQKQKKTGNRPQETPGEMRISTINGGNFSRPPLHTR